MTRRQFVYSAAAGAAVPLIVPRHVLGGVGFRAPSDKLNLAVVGAGGMGMSNMSRLTTEHLAAIADVDLAMVFKNSANARRDRDGNARPDFEALDDAYRQATTYADCREMLDAEKDLDAVLVATPDHFHAVAALHAMQRGLHVYVQKPLTYTVNESRALAAAAAKKGLVTQMGNQGHSNDDGRRAVEVIRSGVLGTISEVHSWTNRPNGWWPQGVGRPEPLPVPEGVNWNVFLGPAPERPYYPGIHPFGWRGWLDYGVSSLGDMGAHLLDFPVWAFELDRPVRVEARHTPWGGDRDDPATYPLAMVASYTFDLGDRMLPLTWYDGGLMPPTPTIAPKGYRLNPDGGVMYVGERGMLIHDTYGENPRLFPESLAAEAATVPVTLPRIETSHEQNWVRAIRGETQVSSPFSYAAHLTEIMLLGIVSARADVPLEIEPSTGRITNHPEAEQYYTRTYRDGWALPVV